MGFIGCKVIGLIGHIEGSISGVYMGYAGLVGSAALNIS